MCRHGGLEDVGNSNHLCVLPCLSTCVFALKFSLCACAGEFPDDAASLSERRAGGSPAAARKLQGIRASSSLQKITQIAFDEMYGFTNQHFSAAQVSYTHAEVCVCVCVLRSRCVS